MASFLGWLVICFFKQGTVRYCLCLTSFNRCSIIFWPLRLAGVLHCISTLCQCCKWLFQLDDWASRLFNTHCTHGRRWCCLCSRAAGFGHDGNDEMLDTLAHCFVCIFSTICCLSCIQGPDSSSTFRDDRVPVFLANASTAARIKFFVRRLSQRYCDLTSSRLAFKVGDRRRAVHKDDDAPFLEAQLDAVLGRAFHSYSSLGMPMTNAGEFDAMLDSFEFVARSLPFSFILTSFIIQGRHHVCR
jgi:hypothetical protein